MVTKSINSSKDNNASRREAGEVELNIREKASKEKFGYEIRLKNHLEPHWTDWFDGWTITNIDSGEVILACSSTDHTGLHGVLDKIRDLNLTLISVKRISSDPSESGEHIEQA